MSISVLGSFMMDLVVTADKLPRNGETIIGNDFMTNPGGKGANQAVTIARLGKPVNFIGMIGMDDYGKEGLATLKQEHVNIDYLFQTRKTTGVGVVSVSSDGSNKIIVVPGANYDFSSECLKRASDHIRKSNLLVMQLEINLSVVEEAVNYASTLGIPVLLNPAPATELSQEILSKVTYLTPNESELMELTKMPISTKSEIQAAATSLIKKGVENVIVTLGDQGSIWLSNDGETIMCPAYEVKVSDTVAAGDSFNGALALGISEKWPKERIMSYANAVGALTVTKGGAIKSLPYKEEVDNFMLKNVKATS